MPNPEDCDRCHQIFVSCKNAKQETPVVEGRNLTIGWKRKNISFQENPIEKCRQRVQKGINVAVFRR